MTVQEWAPIAEAAGALIAAGCALWVTLRDGKLLKSGEAKALRDRIDQAHAAAVGWHESDRGKSLIIKVDAHDVRLSAHELQLQNVATKTDVAKLEGSIEVVAARVGDAAGGIDRIEGMLLKEALAHR